MKQADRILLHPIRMRIVQLIAFTKNMTVAALAAAMPDVPRSSIYHHVAVLHDGGVLEIVREEKVRGTYERAYALRTGDGVADHADIEAAVSGLLLKLFSDFSAYFGGPHARPVEDQLFFSINTLLLSDAEFQALKAELFAVLETYLNRAPGEGRKQRTLSIMSSPGAEAAALEAGR